MTPRFSHFSRFIPGWEGGSISTSPPPSRGGASPTLAEWAPGVSHVLIGRVLPIKRNSHLSLIGAGGDFQEKAEVDWELSGGYRIWKSKEGKVRQ